MCTTPTTVSHRGRRKSLSYVYTAMEVAGFGFKATLCWDVTLVTSQQTTYMPCYIDSSVVAENRPRRYNTLYIACYRQFSVR